ncbi:SMI1/KNR4 family protein [Nocardioides sp. GY 10113]|uniref:SMI1/KNR4 family protein n=1 Tax=Nocardioides sp. GY 10113 TaxID=2569761 RepID=UPI0014580D7A|nr:SMI1/KNR4 family protein [Nocardioides sp. GY 10113]
MAEVDLREALGRLDTALTRERRELAGRLRPGLDPAAVAAALTSIGVSPHPDVVAWYAWHDGAQGPGRGERHFLRPSVNHVLGGLYLFSMEQALALREDAMSYEEDLNDPVHYRPAWFPIMMFPDGWLVCVDTADAAGGLHVWHIHAMHDMRTRVPWIANAATFAEALTLALNSGLTRADDFAMPEGLPAGTRVLDY